MRGMYFGMPRKSTEKIILMKSNRYDVYCYEVFKEEAFYLNRFLPGYLKAGFTHYALGEKKLPKFPPAKIISIRTQSIIPTQWDGKLDAILSRSTGFDHIAKYLKQIKTDIACGYLPRYCSQAVAESAILLVMALMKKLPLQIKQFKTFNRDNLTGSGIKGKKVLVIGVGNIGSKIADIASKLGMKVLCADIVKRFKKFKYVNAETAAKKADIIISAMNLTDDNVNYFDYDFFEKAKKGSVFVNIARGELSPIEDISKAIDGRLLAGAALDVYPDESRLAADLRSRTNNPSHITKTINKLTLKPNVILTPHNAFNTRESTEEKAKQTAEQIVYFLKHKRFKWKVEI